MKNLTDDKRFANTLARGLHILRAFRPTDNGLGNLELSERTGIPRSTVSRLTFTLCALGYLSHGRHHDRYRLGPGSLALGNIASASFGFVDMADPIMQKLADETSALVGIALQDDGEMLMVKTWRPVGSPTIWLDVGYRMPMLRSSTGASFVGALSRAELEALRTRFPDIDPADLAECHRTAREAIISKGYASLQGRHRFTQSINAVAAPYRPSEFGEPVAILCGASSEAMTNTAMSETVGPALALAVRDLCKATGQPFSIAEG